MDRRALMLLAVLGPAGTFVAAGAHAFSPEIEGRDFAAHVAMLASDTFAGRAPATEGEEKTLAYLRAQFQRMGLEPGNGDSYFQKVPVQLRIADAANSHAAIVQNGEAAALTLGTHAVLGSDTGQPEVRVTDSPIVFLGYGIDAPEHRWNDYAGIDVAGKTVLLLAGEPTGTAEGRELFEGRRLTLYSRLTYKAEQAARHGAAAAIVIHDTKAAGYDWEGVKSRWRGEYALRPEDRAQAPVAVQGWISGARARSLFASAGMDLGALRAAAGRAGFAAQPLRGATFSATLKGKVLLAESHNVIARLTGTTRPDEAIVYSAHWDHLGTQAQQARDRIYNGALDNATGVAALLEIAERFATQPVRPGRSVLFLLPTLEEQGLLGSRYYTRHPVIPLGRTVANINVDLVVPIGRARNFVVIGLGYSELDEVVAPIVAAQGRTLSAEKLHPEANHFLRSDHLSFARAGVPVLYMRGGVEAEVAGQPGAPRDATWNRVSSVYHTPNDEFDPRWDLRGVVEDMTVSYEVGRALASSHDWPNYRPGHAFRAVRDASRAAVAQP